MNKSGDAPAGNFCSPRFKPLSISCVVCLWLFPLVASAVVPPLEVRSEKIGSALLKHLEVLEDRAGRLSIADVCGGSASMSFTPATDGRLHAKSTYWFRMQLLSKDEQPTLYAIYIPADYFEIYRSTPEGCARVGASGYLVPWAKRPTSSISVAVPLSLTPDELIWLYVKTSTGAGGAPGAGTFGIKAYIPTMEARAAVHHRLGVFYGLVAAITLLNVTLYVLGRNRLQLLCALFTLNLGLFLYAFDGFATRFVVLSMSAYDSLLSGLGDLCFLTGTLFVFRFVNARKIAPRLRLVAWGILTLFLGIELYGVFVNPSPVSWFTSVAQVANNILIALIILLGVAILFVAGRRGQHSAWILLAGMSVLFVNTVFFCLMSLGVLSSAAVNYGREGWYVGILVLLGFVTFGVAYDARRVARLRRAFSYYLSPQMADRIAELNFDLKPGGKVTDATILFTDCKGFTSVSEELNDPVALSELLIEYFTQTSRCILDNGGTIIKYIGDAVMAAWGAPLEDPAHPHRAAKAAWELSEASKIVVRGRVLTTRVGVSTGQVLAGNLGSPYRFDYTCIGDTTNLASRLEGMNKVLGTSVLISDSTEKRIGREFITRLTGHFALAGKSHGIGIHEILGVSGQPITDFKWLIFFNQALEAIKSGAFDDAKTLLRKTIWERGGEDGPSQFYITKIAQLERRGNLREWSGLVRLDEK